VIGGALAGAWGDGRGIARRLLPEVRLWTWLLCMAACLLARPCRPTGLALVLAVVGAWLATCGVRPGAVLRLVLTSLVLFAPAFLLLPWLGHSEELLRLGPVTLRDDAWVAPLRLLVRGTACLLLGRGLVAALLQHELAPGLSRMPLPRGLLVVVNQVLRSLGVLVSESVAVGRAVALRSGRTGVRAGLELARALPLTWLPRVLARAERVHQAMQVRGYHGELPETPRHTPRWGDALALLLGTGFVALAGLLR